jgi:hypothetical protein
VDGVRRGRGCLGDGESYGQRALGACLLLYVAPRGDYACQATPGRGYVDGMSLKPAS